MGTVHKNKPQLPPEFVNTKSKADKTNHFCYTKDCSLISYNLRGKCLCHVCTMTIEPIKILEK